jgi:hypothetical protein
MQFISSASGLPQSHAFTLVRQVLVAWTLAVLAGCGGGGGGGGEQGAGGVPAAPVPTPPAAAASAATPSIATGQPLIRLQSDSGDFIGAGASYEYDTTNAAITVAARGSFFRVRIEGRENWSGEFQLPGNASELQVGTYTGMARHPFQVAGAGGLSWFGQGRGCNLSDSILTIHAVNYQRGVLRSLDMSFEQRCDSGAGALRGQVRINEAAMALLSVPQNPLPTAPVVALRSEVGDYIGAGAAYAYDLSSAVITVRSQGTGLSVSVQGDEQWNGDFQLPAGTTAWAPGTYSGLTRYPFNTAATGGMAWTGEGRGCNTLTATMTVDRVRYDAGTLRAIDLRFEQRCEGGRAALHGSISWDADQQAQPAPAPQATAPAGLWEPPAGTFAPSGNGMYISSAPGDFIGQGYTWWVGAASPVPGAGATETQGTVTVSVTEATGLLRVNVEGLVRWSGEFKAMNGLQRLQQGYYGIVQRYPFHNPARGGLSWSMDSRGCNELSGWFMVDSVTYQGNQLDSVDLRFSQHCDGSVTPLRGRIRWRSASSAG